MLVYINYKFNIIYYYAADLFIKTREIIKKNIIN